MLGWFAIGKAFNDFAKAFVTATLFAVHFIGHFVDLRIVTEMALPAIIKLDVDP